ncbi:MAG: DUF6273 domain-containing protein [Oscillospiraceae bacterium]|nr:DUF6273 domain-containing protein [Oscillospiraceae bacterium]
MSTNISPNTVMFIFDEVYWSHCMNDTNTIGGGWAESKMQEYLNTEVLSLLPDELVEMIQPRTIRQKVDGRVYEWTGKLWLPSRTEVFGEENDCDIDDRQISFFRNRRNRIALDDADNLCWRWLRTVVSSPTFAYVSSNGNAYNSYASNVNGVRPCFLVRCG